MLGHVRASRISSHLQGLIGPLHDQCSVFFLARKYFGPNGPAGAWGVGMNKGGVYLSQERVGLSLRHHAHKPLAECLTHMAHKVMVWLIELYRILGRCVSGSLFPAVRLETKPLWLQTPSLKRQAVMFKTMTMRSYYDQLMLDFYVKYVKFAYHLKWPIPLILLEHWAVRVKKICSFWWMSSNRRVTNVHHRTEQGEHLSL